MSSGDSRTIGSNVINLGDMFKRSKPKARNVKQNNANVKQVQLEQAKMAMEEKSSTVTHLTRTTERDMQSFASDFQSQITTATRMFMSAHDVSVSSFGPRSRGGSVESEHSSNYVKSATNLKRPQHASICHCNYFIEEKKVMALLRHSAPAHFSAEAYVSRRIKNSLNIRSRFEDGPRAVEIHLGTLFFYHPVTSATEHAADKFFIGNMVDLSYAEGSSSVAFKAFPDFGGVLDDNGHRRKKVLVKYNVKFQDVEEAEKFARTLLTEADNFATLIDLGIPCLAEYKDNASRDHILCLKRKRVDLFAISRRPNNEALLYAQENLAQHLREDRKDDEAQVWQDQVDFYRTRIVQRQNSDFTAASSMLPTPLTRTPGAKGIARLQEEFEVSRENDEVEHRLLEQKMDELFSGNGLGAQWMPAYPQLDPNMGEEARIEVAVQGGAKLISLTPLYGSFLQEQWAAGRNHSKWESNASSSMITSTPASSAPRLHRSPMPSGKKGSSVSVRTLQRKPASPFPSDRTLARKPNETKFKLSSAGSAQSSTPYESFDV